MSNIYIKSIDLIWDDDNLDPLFGYENEEDVETAFQQLCEKEVEKVVKYDDD